MHRLQDLELKSAPKLRLVGRERLRQRARGLKADMSVYALWYTTRYSLFMNGDTYSMLLACFQLQVPQRLEQASNLHADSALRLAGVGEHCL